MSRQEQKFSSAFAQSVGGGNNDVLILQAHEPLPEKTGLPGVLIAPRHAFVVPEASTDPAWNSWVERGFAVQAKNWEETGQVLDFNSIFKKDFE